MSPSGQTESPASVNLSVAFANFVRSERPLWMRSVLQVILQPKGLLRGLVRTTKAVVEENVCHVVDTMRCEFRPVF